MLKDWSKTHEENTLSEAVMDIKKLEPGQIVRFNYQGEYSHVKRPLVLILNGNWRGMIHGVILDNINDSILLKLKNIVDVEKSRLTNVLKKLRLSLLKVDIKDPYRFYYKKLQPFIKVNFNSTNTPYRTYFLANVKNLRLIDYRFKDMYEPEKK